MTHIVSGGQTTYGHMVGILMNDSTIPRIPGDPGHAETFDFPVIYEILKDFPFEDLIAIKKDHMEVLIKKAKSLQAKGVSLIATDCGLFGPFHRELKKHLEVSFIGSALDLVPLLQRFLPADKKVGIITGDTRILQDVHLESSGIDPDTVVVTGMENCPEFNKVVIERRPELNIENMRQGVVDAASGMSGNRVGAIVLECTNLISFRSDIQNRCKTPVFDLVSLIEFFISGFSPRTFHSRFIR